MILIYELREFTGLFIEIHLGIVQNLVCKTQKMIVDVYINALWCRYLCGLMHLTHVSTSSASN